MTFPDPLAQERICVNSLDSIAPPAESTYLATATFQCCAPFRDVPMELSPRYLANEMRF